MAPADVDSKGKEHMSDLRINSLDIDPFASSSTATRIDHLFQLRRATHGFLVRHAATLWTQEQRLSGRCTMAPPHTAALPAQQQPHALAADEAARLKRAHLYGLDEAATTAAVALGADMVDYTTTETDPDGHRAWTPVAAPPTELGLLRWASGIGYNSLGVPLIACHWGPLPQGTWLAWWPDNRFAVANDIALLGVTRHQAQLVLREFGPLACPDLATILTPRPDAQPDTAPDKTPGSAPATGLPDELQADRHLLALISTVLASWALLATPGAAHLITRHPTAVQAANDRRAGLKPRAATLATGPIDTTITER